MDPGRLTLRYVSTTARQTTVLLTGCLRAPQQWDCVHQMTFTITSQPLFALLSTQGSYHCLPSHCCDFVCGCFSYTVVSLQ